MNTYIADDSVILNRYMQRTSENLQIIIDFLETFARKTFCDILDGFALNDSFAHKLWKFESAGKMNIVCMNL